jgi:hypothetical protein
MHQNGFGFLQRPAVDKHISQRFHMETSNLRKSKKVEVKESYRVEVTDRFAGISFNISSQRVSVASYW